MQIVVARSIEVFGPDEWNALFPGELEDWAYYRAVERSNIGDFDWLYFGVREGGKLVAVCPAFVTDYRLDTTVTGSLRKLTDFIRRFFRRFLRQRMIALGSPVAEECHLGFDPSLDENARRGLLEFILDNVEVHARNEHAGLIAAKDTCTAQDGILVEVAGAHHLRRQPGLPTAALDVNFDSVDQYLRSLSRGMRKDLRRKLKSTTPLRCEWRSNIDDIIDDVMRLYAETRARAEIDFEELTPEYFRGVLADLGSRARCSTVWLGDRLVAFNLVLLDNQRLIDKFLGMDYTIARAYNLYFYTWIENVRYCIEHRIPVYQSGQGLHHQKRRLGSRLSAHWLWYRHRNRVVDAVLALLEGLARLDRHDPQWAELS